QRFAAERSPGRDEAKRNRFTRSVFRSRRQCHRRPHMAQATTDHGAIRKWAEAKGGKPGAVDRTHKGGDVGIIRIMFPDNLQSEHQSLVEISWDEFFREFESRKLALLYEQD